MHLLLTSFPPDITAYTRYSFFEWSLIVLDVLYDSSAELDFQAADLKVGPRAPHACYRRRLSVHWQITIGSLAGGSFDRDKMYQQLHRLV